jgi:hypothetical protein
MKGFLDYVPVEYYLGFLQPSGINAQTNSNWSRHAQDSRSKVYVCRIRRHNMRVGRKAKTVLLLEEKNVR